MKKYKLDAKGMACPLPVVKTKKLMEEYDTVETTVDNFTATQNLGKLAEQMDYSIDVKENSVIFYCRRRSCHQPGYSFKANFIQCVDYFILINHFLCQDSILIAISLNGCAKHICSNSSHLG